MLSEILIINDWLKLVVRKMIVMIVLNGIASNGSVEGITVMNEKWNFMLAIRVPIYHLFCYVTGVVEAEQE